MEIAFPIAHRSIEISDKSSVGEARRAALQLAQALGFDEERRSNIGFVATELATNVQIHAVRGELLLCPFVQSDACWLDLIAVDSGPGIADVTKAMADGFSSIGTAGHGLGAVGRLADSSSLYSAQGKGTAYWARFVKINLADMATLGVVNIPIRGESVCGDSYLVVPGSVRSLYMMVDGLGHGAGAAEAANEAVNIVRQNTNEPAMEILLRCHDGLRKTRGAAMSVALLDHGKRTLTYAGVGNISASLVSSGPSRSLVSQNGTLGVAMPRSPREFTYPVQPNSLLMMFSDGLHSKLGLGDYPGLRWRHSELIAAMMYRDFTRGRDDATVLVAPVGTV